MSKRETSMANVTQTFTLFSESLHLSVADRGAGKAFLILHGGAGPASVTGLAEALAEQARTIVPIHPGFAGQPRPSWFHRIDDLVLAYLALLDRLDVSEVVVIGNSIGGWIAAEMALRRSPRIAGIVLLNAVGINAGPGARIGNPMELPPEKRASLAFNDPTRFAFPQTPETVAMMSVNQNAIFAYAGEPYMHDPGLKARLAEIDIPALVVWGESDGIVDLEYGRHYAESIPDGRFEVIAEAGHFPHIEKLDDVLAVIGAFVRTVAKLV
jgi:pimeloyl-ACP methyl ester carboxylesterase